MKLTVTAAALALAIGTSASAFAAPPATTKAPAAPVTTPAPTSAAIHVTAPAKAMNLEGTIKIVSDTGFTLTSGKAFRFDTSVKSSSVKSGEKVKVQYRMKNHQRWATEVTPS